MPDLLRVYDMGEHQRRFPLGCHLPFGLALHLLRQDGDVAPGVAHGFCDTPQRGAST
jgi:hypothetical protein